MATKVIEYVPVGPFRAWLNERYEQLAAEERANEEAGPAQRLAEEIGWGSTENAARRLYRYRRGTSDTSRGTRKSRVRVVMEAPGYSRAVVEDALHSAGVDFYEVYPEYAHERDGAPEPEAWCPSCRSHVMVERAGNGRGFVYRCIWCRWKMSKGHLNEHAPELVA